MILVLTLGPCFKVKWASASSLVTFCITLTIAIYHIIIFVLQRPHIFVKFSKLDAEVIMSQSDCTRGVSFHYVTGIYFRVTQNSTQSYFVTLTCHFLCIWIIIYDLKEH